jgi:hypothetical protein
MKQTKTIYKLLLVCILCMAVVTATVLLIQWLNK